MHIPEHFRLAAKKGAALLDEERPGWAKAVNLVTLDLGDMEYCVLGQLHRNYTEGVSALALDGWDDEVEMGFTLGHDRRPWDWVKLTRAWVSEIARR